MTLTHTVTLAVPSVPHGPVGVEPAVADAEYYRAAARNIRHAKSRGQKFAGSNLTETVAALCDAVAGALTAPVDVPAAPRWDGPIYDAEALNREPAGTVAMDDTGTLRQRRYADSIDRSGWTAQGRGSLTSLDLVEHGTRPVWLLRTDQSRRATRWIVAAPTLAEARTKAKKPPAGITVAALVSPRTLHRLEGVTADRVAWVGSGRRGDDWRAIQLAAKACMPGAQ